MATLGFEEVTFGIHDGETEVIKKLYTVNAAEGGAISLKISGLAPEAQTIYASNVPFYAGMTGVGTPKCDIETADLSDEVLAAISGALYEDGVIKAGANTVAPYVTVMAKTKGLANDDIYVALLKGKFGVPDAMELATGEDKGLVPNTTDGTLSGTFVNRKLDNFTYFKARSSAEGFILDTFRTLVFNGYVATP